MKFTCEKLLLLTAILTSSRGAAIKSPVASLEGLLIEAMENDVKITGYDLKIGIVTTVPAQIEEEGGIVLNARLFGEIIRKMPGQNVTVSVNAGLVAAISSEMSDFEILGSPSLDYPELPSVDSQDSIVIEEAILKKMIAQTNFAVSDNESRPIHTGALFEIGGGELTIVAVDGYRLALRRESLDNDSAQSFSFVVPGNALGEVEKITSDGKEEVNITVGTKHIMFMIGETMLISRRLEGEFLNYRNSIPQSSKYRFKIVKSEIIAATERVALIINEKMKNPVRCVFDDGIVQLYSATALGKASDECSMSGDGEGLEIGFNDRYLLDALKAAPADDIIFELSSGVTPCVISPADDSKKFVYMILPVRLKSYDS
ncbi:MAG: DNA polymerase III subunit beta [Oscillospiraceae bacterium]|nr:DNA polymerase III subunit beta [Oscillospiraceae bacterium]